MAALGMRWKRYFSASPHAEEAPIETPPAAAPEGKRAVSKPGPSVSNRAVGNRTRAVINRDSNQLIRKLVTVPIYSTPGTLANDGKVIDDVWSEE